MTIKTDTWIEAFEPGTHTDSNGNTITFTAADVQDIANSYDPTKWPMPFVAGHPKTEDPAFGLAAKEDIRFNAETGKVEVNLRNMAPEFAQAIDGGRYNTVSLAMWAPNDPQNRNPGHWTTKHLGFLGAVPPALKGLKPLGFSEGDTAHTFSATADLDESDQALWDRFKSIFLRKIPQTAASFAAPTVEEDDMTDKVSTEQLQREQAQLEAEKAAHKAQVAAFAEQQKQQYRVGALAFCESLCSKGRLEPAKKIALAESLTALKQMQPLTFAENGANQQASAYDVITEQLSKLPVGGHMGAPVVAGNFAQPAQFSSAPSGELDQMDAKAKAYAAKNGVDYETALDAVVG